jgi:hypothetical protein
MSRDPRTTSQGRKARLAAAAVIEADGHPLPEAPDAVPPASDDSDERERLRVLALELGRATDA